MDPRTLLSEAEIRDHLARSLPQWRYQEGHLTRTYRTGNWQTTLLVANAIGFLAEAAWHHPELILNYPSVQVRLRSHDVDGITARDLELAARIEATITWYPGPEEVLEGKPGQWVEGT